MKKLLTKNWVKRIVISLLLLLAVSFIPALGNQTHAAQGACPNGFEEVLPNGARCEAPADAGLTCPEATYNTVSGEQGKLTCSKKSQAVNSDFNSSIQSGIGFISIITQVLSKILWPLLALIGGLMDNSLLFGNGMEARLREIWIVVRNIVNILFVIGLLVIAFYNVLGLGEEGSSLSIKSALPKIIVGIVAVNFSFLGIKVFLDGVNVMTSAVFALPQQVSEETAKIDLPADTQKLLCAKLQDVSANQLNEANQEAISNQRLTSVYSQVAQMPEFGLGDVSNNNLDQIRLKVSELSQDKQDLFNSEVDQRLKVSLCDGGKLSTTGEQFLSSYNSRNAAFAMALNMGNIALYDTADFANITKVVSDKTTLDKLAISLVFALVLYVVYAAAFVALFIVLIARLVFMWVSVAISPVLILLLAAPDLRSKLGGIGDLTDKFVKTAIAPIIIGFSMSVGWIMLRALQSVNNAAQNTGVFSFNSELGIPVSGVNNLQDLMIAITAVAVVWVGVFTAADSTIAQGATNWVRDRVSAAGKWIGQIPLRHAPIFPVNVPGGNGEDENFTGEQVKEFLYQGANQIGGDRNRLADRFFGRSGANTKVEAVKPRDYRGIQDHENLRATVLNDIAANNGRAMNKANLRELKSVLQDNRGKRMIDELSRGNGKDRELAKSLEAIRGAENDRDLVSAGQNLQRTVSRNYSSEIKKLRQSGSENQAKPKSDKPAPTQEAPKAQTADIKVGNITYNGVQNVDDQAKTALNDKFAVLLTAVNEGKSPAEVKQKIREITAIQNQDGIKVKFNPKQFKDSLDQGSDGAADRLSAIVPDDELTQELNPTE